MSKLPPAVGKKPEALKTDAAGTKSEKSRPEIPPKPGKKPIHPPKPLPKPESTKPAELTSPVRPKVAAKPSHLVGRAGDPQMSPKTEKTDPLSPKQLVHKMGPPATPKRDFLKPQPPPSREQSRERSQTEQLRAPEPSTPLRSSPTRSPARSPAPPPPRSRDVSRARDMDVGETKKPLSRDVSVSRDPDLGGPLLVPPPSGATVSREGAVAPAPKSREASISRENTPRDDSPRGRAVPPHVTKREGAIAPASRVPSIVEPASPLAVRKSRDTHVTTPEQARTPGHVTQYTPPAPGDRVSPSSYAPGDRVVSSASASSYTPPAPKTHVSKVEGLSPSVSRDSSVAPVVVNREAIPVTVTRESVPPAPVVVTRESAAPPVARDTPPPVSRDLPVPVARDPPIATPAVTPTPAASLPTPPTRESTSSAGSASSRDSPAPPARKPLPDPTSFAAPPVHHAVASRREELKREDQAASAPPALPRRRETDLVEPPRRRETHTDLVEPPRRRETEVEPREDFPPPPRRATDTGTPRFSRQSSSASLDSRESPYKERHGSTASIASVDHLRHPERSRQGSASENDGLYSSKSVLSSHLEPPPARQTVMTSETGELDNELNPSAAIDGYQDYPDSSNINRKPPVNVRRAQCSLKHDVKCMDCNDEYLVACSSGYTFVLSADSLELLFSEPHNDLKIHTVKVTSTNHAILGFKEGELWEVDLDDGTVSVKRSTSHSTAIVLIHESPNGLYTLSEDGRVCVWPGDDESPLCGTPKQHKLSFGFIRQAVGVQDTIWVGKSRNAFVFHESMNFMNPLVVSSTVPGNRPSLDFSCIFHDSGNVYFGHENGNITVFSTATTQVVAQQFVSPSCPQTIYCSNGMLWIGFKNGSIQIVNVREPQWKIIKAFEGHQSGVSGIVGGSKAVTSFGSSPNLRFWDASLREYWEDDLMAQRQEEYCDYQDLSVAVITWNCGALKPSQMQRAKKNDKYWIDQTLEEADYPDIVVFGFQELVELSDKGLSAKALLGLHKKDDISDQYQLWEDELCHLMGKEYRRVKSHYLVGLFSCVFARDDLHLRHVQYGEVKTGLGGYHGNKGAVCIRFTIADSSLCFVNVHLAAGQSKVSDRVKDLESCFSKDLFKKDWSRDEDGSRVYINGGDGSYIADHENLFILGDMNFRVNQHPKLAVQHVNNHRLEKLLLSDQLTIQMKKNISFPLRSFAEHEITFAPTYKFDVGTDTYDSSEKKRVPSWCDRILYRGHVECLRYDSKVVRLSDHRPVVGQFGVKVKRINSDRYDLVRAEVRQELDKAVY
ncbi:putative inositol polyphosphate 5-phosphatase C9G1.10c [Yarrowia sp. B02]|nr:putative inositol polyphosphate 5-phosphatase C9G1.10c [Yarrowia sp. B02]